MAQAQYRTRNNPDIVTDLTKPIRNYFGIIPLSGGALTAGAAYWTGLTVEFLRGTLANVPYVIQQPEYQQIYDTLHTAFQQGKDQGANWALAGGVIGLILTNKFKNAIVSFIRR